MVVKQMCVNCVFSRYSGPESADDMYCEKHDKNIKFYSSCSDFEEC